jgi:hypothetical protein
VVFRCALRQDWSWRRSAHLYLDIYRSIMQYYRCLQQLRARCGMPGVAVHIARSDVNRSIMQ